MKSLMVVAVLALTLMLVGVLPASGQEDPIKVCVSWRVPATDKEVPVCKEWAFARVVRKGDTLWRIGGARWRRLLVLNPWLREEGVRFDKTTRTQSLVIWIYPGELVLLGEDNLGPAVGPER